MNRIERSSSAIASLARFVAVIPTASLLCSAPTAARSALPVSEFVIDAGTGRPLFAANADQPRSPASLAKLMTVLLAFDALDHGKLRSGDQLVMTADGERQRPSRLGLARGRSIGLQDALRATAVISANDVAVALADRLGGNEARFVTMMNRRAAKLGLAHTFFGNATGLPPGAGTTTARDLATLSRYIIRHCRRHYAVFSTRSIRWEGQVRPNHNQLLGKVTGLDGIKTGYTWQAGFNLAASAQRAGRRIIVIVMGAKTAAARDLRVSNLIEAGFTSPVRARPYRR